ncbi:MAG TPA: hypothetical protein VME69_09425 [Methylocella sp.]|nr:hypothetical protein [Methylocella sp.]
MTSVRQCLQGLLVVLFAVLWLPGLARAQLLLPGAVQAAPPGTSTAGPQNRRPLVASAKPNPAVLRPPSEDTIFGLELAQDGNAGAILVERATDKSVAITKLSLAGQTISHPGEPCQVEVVADAPIPASFAGRPRGILRYLADIPACPFSIDILDGAVLVERSPPSCDFNAADCRVAPAGLWGPPGQDFRPDQVNSLERERSHAETALRLNFRSLMKEAGKDREAIRKIASEQAGFSSERVEICRRYKGEDVHGFCALRVTQARAFALQATYEELAKLHQGSGKSTMKKAAMKPKLNTSAEPLAPLPR